MPEYVPKKVALVLAGAALIVLPCLRASAQVDDHSANLEIIHGKPFVMVMVNGKGPFRFVIDTGTGGEAFVSADLVAQLAIPKSGQITLNDPSGLGGQKVPLVMLDSLEVAGVEFSGVKAAVHDLGSEIGRAHV